MSISGAAGPLGPVGMSPVNPFELPIVRAASPVRESKTVSPFMRPLFSSSPSAGTFNASEPPLLPACMTTSIAARPFS